MTSKRRRDGISKEKPKNSVRHARGVESAEGTERSSPAAYSEPSERVEWDRGVAGLGKRLRNGNATWIVQGRRDGLGFKYTLGPVGGIDVDTARLMARELLRRRQEHAFVLDAPLFENFAETFIRDTRQRWKPATYRRFANVTHSHLVPAFRGRRIDAIEPPEVRLWYESTRSSSDWALATLSALMDHAEALGLRPDLSNPCRGMRRKQSGFKATYPTADDYRAIGCAMAALAIRYPETLPIVRFVALTGARRGEALAIQWAHVHENRVALPDSKSGRKTIWLPRAAAAVIHACGRRDGVPYVFGGADRRRVERNVEHCWDQLRRAAGVSFRLHDLRHGFASVAVQRNHDLRTVSRLLSHADPDTTLGYAHLASDQVESAADRVSMRLQAALEGGRTDVVNASRPEVMDRVVKRYYALLRDSVENAPSPRNYCATNGIDFDAFKVAMRAYRERCVHLS